MGKNRYVCNVLCSQVDVATVSNLMQACYCVRDYDYSCCVGLFIICIGVVYWTIMFIILAVKHTVSANARLAYASHNGRASEQNKNAHSM